MVAKIRFLPGPSASTRQTRAFRANPMILLWCIWMYEPGFTRPPPAGKSPSLAWNCNPDGSLIKRLTINFDCFNLSLNFLICPGPPRGPPVLDGREKVSACRLFCPPPEYPSNFKLACTCDGDSCCTHWVDSQGPLPSSWPLGT